MSKVNLDSPAFGPGAIANEPKENVTTQPSQGESENRNETKVEPTSGGEPVVAPPTEEQRVPYSRLKAVTDARREAEDRAAEAEDRYQRLLSEREQRQQGQFQQQVELPTWWVKLYGDTDQSKEAYSYELERQQTIREEARREALEAVREERAQEGQVLSSNERIIDNRLEDLGQVLGRDVTEQEEASILDIVDEYTPKDRDGNYAGELISFEKAWEIHELRQSQATGKTRQARRAPTDLTSQSSQGEPTGKEKDDKNWNPLDWNSWKRRIPN